MPTRPRPVMKAKRAECATPVESFWREARRPPNKPAMPTKCNIRSMSRTFSMGLSLRPRPFRYGEVVALGVR